MPRRFLDWTTDALPAAAAALLAEHAVGAVADLSEVVVVLPGGRAGRRLKELLVEQAGEGGLRLIPPEVTTIGRLPERLFESPGPVASRNAATLAWARAARGTPPDRLGLLYGEPPSRSAFDEWVRIGRQLHGLHREVAGAGRRFADVGALVSRTLSGELGRGETLRWEVLAEIQQGALGLLKREALWDPDMARVTALERERVRTERDVWLVAITEMPPVTRGLLAAVRDRVTALVHAPESRGADFDDLGCLKVEPWLKAAIDLAPDEVRIADRPGDQAVEVARALAEVAEGRPPDEVVIGAPDPEVIPYVEERLAALGVSTRDGAGRELRRTAPYRLLTALAELLASGRWPAFTAFVRHPDVESWIDARMGKAPELRGARLPGTGWLEALDRWTNEHLPADVPAEYGARGFQGRTGDHGDTVAAVLRIVGRELVGELAEEPSRRPISAWIGPILGFLERAYGERTLDTAHPEHRELTRALGELASGAQGWTGLPQGLDEACEAASALRLLLGGVADRAIPFAHDPESVEILGWLELHLDDAPVTVVAGVNAPFLPESVQGEPFLSESLRVDLGLEHNALRHAREVYRLTAMKASGRTLRLIGGRRSAEGDRLRPSPLLLADARTERVARRLRRFYDGTEPGAAPASDAGGEAAAGATPAPETPTSEDRSPDAPQADGSLFQLPPEPTLTFTPPDSLPVTAFARLLSDPYGFALERMRGCEEVHDREREMNGALFGSLAHQVLEEFGRDPAVDSDDERTIRAALDRLLDEAVRLRFGPGGRYAQVTVRLQVEQLRSRLHRFAAWHADWIADGWAVQGVECRTPKGGAPLMVEGEPMGIRARVDRVDYHAGRGRWAVFDYKTSDAGEKPEKTHLKGPKGAKEWVDLQLPLYRWLLPHLVDGDGEPLFPGVGGDPVEVGYLLLPRDLEGVGAAMAEWSDAEHAEALEVARRVIVELRRGKVTFDRALRAKWPAPAMDALLGRTQLAAFDGGDEDDEEDDG